MEELEEARLLKDELDRLRPIDAEQEARVMQKFRLDWNYHSNHLEGNSLTYGETRALLLFGVTAQGKPLKDTLEMTGHNEAVDWVIDMVKGERPLTESFIRELHTLLLKEPYEKKAETPDGQPTTKRIEVGKYKSSPNHVKTVTGEIFYFATPEETPAKMGDLMAWYQEKRNDDATNPILLAAEFHYRFIRIHPFDDGNGRTARLLMNFILMQYGYPPVIIKTEDKENYFAVLRLADAGQLEPFVKYIAANLLRSLQIMIAGAKGEEIDDPDDLNKEIALLEQKILYTSNSKQVAMESFVASILELVNQYRHKMSLFGKLYQSHSSGTTPVFKSDEAFNHFLNGVFKNKTLDWNLFLSSNFEHMIGTGFGDVNYHSEISLYFNSSGYLVTMPYKSILEKPGRIALTKSEIKKIVQTAVDAHKIFIQIEIERNKEQ